MKLEADLHVHTVASGHGYSTIKENVEKAKEKGLKTIAITDHGLNMPGAPHLYHFTNMISLPRTIEGVEVLRGVEANILDGDGSLDMPDVVMADYLDIVLAGLHEGTGYEGTTKEENTEAMVAAIKNPYVHVITHPDNPKFPIDLERVVGAAKEYNKALELNNSSFIVRPGSPKICRQIARLCKEYKVLVSINSDAHICYNVGETSKVSAIALKEGIEKSQIINSSSQMLNEYLTWHKNNARILKSKAQ
ncbi:MAG: phosphatase [Tissierellia bacterium]|nr:phosphatase [Tissierellia bacterium]